MKKLIAVLLITGSMACHGQDLYIGKTPFEEITSPYLIVQLHVFPRYRAASIDFGQDCTGYESIFQIPQRRRVCDGLNDDSASPVELHSIAHMLNLMANQGYELDRIMGEEEDNSPSDPWESTYLFKRKDY